QCLAQSSETLILALKERHGFRVEAGKKLLRMRAGMCHSIIQYEVGKIAVAEQLRLLAAKAENLSHQRAIVELAGSGPAIRGLPELAANGTVIQISHGRDVAGGLEREAPAWFTFGFGACLG